MNGSSVFSSRTMPTKPTSADGISRDMPSSMPRPARRIGTTKGRGFDSRTPMVFWIGVSISTGSTRTASVASYARSITSSSTRRRNVGESVLRSRSRLSL